jgi:hypothetical protein
MVIELEKINQFSEEIYDMIDELFEHETTKIFIAKCIPYFMEKNYKC